jgi:hypothetical protein
MLSQYDRQQLELISSRLQMDDPDLAKALRDGKPRPTPTNRRWPYVILGILAGLVFLAGVAVGAFGFLFTGAVGFTAVVLLYRRQTRRSPKIRRHGRR